MRNQVDTALDHTKERQCVSLFLVYTRSSLSRSIGALQAPMLAGYTGGRQDAVWGQNSVVAGSCSGGHIASKPTKIPGDTGSGQAFKLSVGGAQTLPIYIFINDYIT